MRSTRERQSISSQEKGREEILYIWVLHVYRENNDSLCSGETLDENVCFTILITLPPLFPTIKNNHIL